MSKEVKYQDIVSLKVGELIREEEKIIRLKIAEEAELDVSDIKEIFAKGKELMEGASYCLLTDARSSLQATNEARIYAANHIVESKIMANAILVNSLPVALIANFYIRINRPPVPTQMFRKELNAFVWLHSIIENELSD